MTSRLRSTHAGKAELDGAIEAWRVGNRPREVLSEAGRSRLLDLALQEGSSRGSLAPLVPLFFPLRRWAWAGALPAVLLTVAFGILIFPMAPGDHATVVTRVDAIKLPGEVVFLISNGGREHRVSKRTIPDGAPPGTVVPTQGGSFRDALESEETIVFYRID